MASIKRFWSGVGRRSRCGECGYEGEPDQHPHRDDTPKLTLRRSHHETRATFVCPECVRHTPTGFVTVFETTVPAEESSTASNTESHPECAMLVDRGTP